MNQGQAPAGKRPIRREYPQGEARLDRARAVEELKRFLDIAVREMNLEIEYEILSPGAAEEPEVTVSQGRPVVFSLETHTIVSIPTTPGREVRRQAAEAAKKRSAAKTKK